MRKKARLFLPAPRWYNTITQKQWALAVATVLVLFVGILFAMGRTPICTCDYIKLWHGVVHSSENSQHIADWYTPSHVIHGFGFYFLLWLFARRLPIGFRLLIAVMLEVSWELLENTDVIINRYRTATISLDYYGDSIINSFFDTLAAIAGFFIARRLPVKATIALALLFELIMGYFIRDNLILNIIMLIYPFKSILDWQAGAILVRASL